MAEHPNGKPGRDPSRTATQQADGKDRRGPTIAERIRRVASDPKKGARLIARSFYRELRRAGWADGDIMAIADELLGCLLTSLHEYRQKTEVPVGQGTERT